MLIIKFKIEKAIQFQIAQKNEVGSCPTDKSKKIEHPN